MKSEENLLKLADSFLKYDEQDVDNWILRAKTLAEEVYESLLIAK